MVASAPPQIMTSASSCWMARAASPMAWALVEQADTWLMFGPLAPKRIDSWPGARLMMICGTKNGEMPCRGPLACSVVWVASRVVRPPRPAPT